MDARPRTSTMAAKALMVVFVIVVITIFLMGQRLTSSVARVQGERVFENTIPKDVPIKIKIKKEKEASFKDLKNDKWAREFELELTNTGDKPIYYVYLDLVTDVRIDGKPLVFSLQYGRSELGDLVSTALFDDVPIKPGETYVFKLHNGQIPAWEKSVLAGKHPEATRLHIALQALSFGDGTGYFGNTPYPPAIRRQSRNVLQPEQQNKSRPKPLEWPTAPHRALNSSTSNEPASYLPVSLLDSKSSNSMEGVSQSNCQVC